MTLDQEDIYYYRIDEGLFKVRVHEPAHHVPEAVVQRLWQKQAFHRNKLRTTTGTPIKIIHPGVHNTNSGPDFMDAKLALDQMNWAGAVEIHIHSRQWYHHNHHKDPRYNNTILHVALFEDEHTGTLIRQDGSILPELVLYPYLHTTLRKLIYATYSTENTSFPCEAQWAEVPNKIKSTWIKKLAQHRMAFRKSEIEHMFLQTPDYEEVLHQQLFKGLGLDKNGDAMLELARRIPLRINRELESAIEIEALHFGISGLLPSYKEARLLHIEAAAYVDTLHNEFSRLQKRFSIPTMRAPSWLFFRLRPANFPTLRIAQATSWLRFGSLLYHDPAGRLMESIQSTHPLAALHSVLQCSPSAFWINHYRFKKKTKPGRRKIGEQRLYKLIVNCVAPLFLLLAEQTQNPALEGQIQSLLNRLPAENDYITRLFKRNGFTSKNSFMSQGLHELYTMYCRPLGCLQCDAGKYILQNASELPYAPTETDSNCPTDSAPGKG